jgi:hypothetical protein
MTANLINPPWAYGDPRAICRGCPACGSTNVARTLFGLPAFTEDLESALAMGKIVLGGCMIEIDETGHSQQPERYCNACGTGWGRWVGPQSMWPGVRTS